MKIKGLIFDLDGVIVDTAIYHFQAWRRMANDLGFDISEEFDEKLKGVSRMESLEIILKHGGIEVSEERKLELAKQKNEDYLELVGDMTPNAILKGIPEFFQQIKEFNDKCLMFNGKYSSFSTKHSTLKIALGSVSKNAKMILEKIDLLKEFDVIIDGTKISKGKPDPEVFLKGAAELGFLPEECIVFEDAVAGVKAGKNAGMKVVGLGKPDILTEADVVFPSLQGVKLEELLQKLN
jgi:beta-phosphoglucomutase